MAVEGAIPMTAATFKAAVQSAKGTAASTKFICALATASGLGIEWDKTGDTPEHGCGTNDRPTRKKSIARRTSYMANGRIDGKLYSRMLPILLAGAGFEISTADNTTHYTHTCTLAGFDDVNWITVLRKLGTRELRAVDCKLTSLELGGDANGLTLAGRINGLTTGDSAGTESSTNEMAQELVASAGSISVQWDPDDSATEIAVIGSSNDAFENRLTIDNPVDTNQQTMFSFGRADLPPTGLGITGRIGGVDIDWETYDRIVRGAAAGTSPSASQAIAAIDYTYATLANISGAAVPYSVQVEIPYVEIELDPAGFEGAGADLVRWAFTYEMADDKSLLDTTEPITITVVNDVAAY